MKKILRAIARGLHGRLWLVRFDLWSVRGTERHSGGDLAFVYGGDEPHMNYLARVALGDTYRVQKLGRAWAWEVESAARRRAPDASLLVLEFSSDKEKTFRRLASCPTRFRIPLWLRMEVDLVSGRETPRAKQKQRNMRRCIRNYGFEAEITKDIGVLKDFYERMHLPYIKKRHGESSVIRDFPQLSAHFEAYCELLLVKTEDGPVGGVVIDYSEGIGKGLIMGVVDGSEEWLRNGLSDAIFHYKLERIKEKGSVVANLGHSRPHLKDGALQYKRKLGGFVSKKLECGYFSLCFLKESAALKSFLLQNPFVSVEEDGECHAVVFSEDAPEATPERLDPLLSEAYCEGLPRMDVYAFSGVNGHELSLLPPSGEPKTIVVRNAHKLMGSR